MNANEMNTIVNPLLEVNNDVNFKKEPTPLQEKRDILTAEEKFMLMKEIEIKTENKMKELYQTGQLLPPLPIALGAIDITPEVGKQQMNLLEETMQVGADEFKQKMGRNMTYSEMRMMFG
jgi:hypothetical protein